jgi:hypothetical protein
MGGAVAGGASIAALAKLQLCGYEVGLAGVEKPDRGPFAWVLF